MSVTTWDKLEVICRNPTGEYKILKVQFEAAFNQFRELTDSCAPASDPAKFALRLLSVFFSEKELAK